MPFSLVFRRRYSMAHRLVSGVAPRCGVPHGHDEVVTVELEAADGRGLDPDTNMLAEFGAVKRRWFGWIDGSLDHSFHLCDRDPLIGYFREREPEILPRLLVSPGDPTTEIRAACYRAKLDAFLAAEGLGLRCRTLRIDETPTNAVSFDGDPASVLPDGDRWWTRADDSINDL